MLPDMNMSPNLDVFYSFPKWSTEKQNEQLSEQAFLVDKECLGEETLRIFYYSGFFIEQYEKKNGMFENIPYKQGYRPSQFFDASKAGKLKDYLIKDSNRSMT